MRKLDNPFSQLEFLKVNRVMNVIRRVPSEPGEAPTHNALLGQGLSGLGNTLMQMTKKRTQG